MILESLVGQLTQRFQHEKRARVCLWFDERAEFARILPKLKCHIETYSSPAFVLLSYDEEVRRGQIWLKHQIYRRLAAADPSERDALRFVLYVPLPEERFDAPDRGDETRLDLLEEYRAAGIFFRIGGKRPTLYSFLKQAGVALPENASDQRRLYDGGPDSLLAKYTSKFIDRPSVFWETTLTPDIAQARLIGDVDQTIFELAADPDGAWKDLQENGLDREFVGMVEDRYGFEAPDCTPSEWLRDFVTTIAVTETFLGYHEPADFPLIDRLPTLPLRSNSVALLHRWLRDAEFRPAWDRWVAETEKDIDLSKWATDRPGHSVAIPHLVLQRWRRTWVDFEKASAKSSTTAAFFEQNRTRILEQAECLRASNRELGHWQTLGDLDAFVTACAAGLAAIASTSAAKDLVALYVENARRIEGAHLEIRRVAEEAGLTAVTVVADRNYAEYTNALNEAVFRRVAEASSLDGLGLPAITPKLEVALWNASGRRAVIIVDALRYDCAVAIGDRLKGQSVEVTPALGTLPTVTAIGMTAMLPLSGSSVTLELKNNSLHPRIDGKDMAARENRLTFLRKFGADCREIDDVEAASEAPAPGELLVVFGHDEVDHIGHGTAATLIRHIHTEIDRLARLVRKLHRWGYGHVHIVTDHGFILLDEQKLPKEVVCDAAWCHVMKERFALVPANSDLPLVTLPFAWDSAIRVAVPPGLAFFKAEKSFSHGGAAVQEMVIPHLVSQELVAQPKRVEIEVVLPTFELQLTSVKVRLRPVAAPGVPSPQLDLFGVSGRTVSLDVVRRGSDGETTSVLAGPPKSVRIEPNAPEQSVTLFFGSATSFQKGELLELDIRDVETTEQFPPGGIKLTVGRDM